MTRRIAMWSGPRNLSTAMMYAFAARKDCTVIDEPFYAAYLAQTGLDHPMRAEVLASQPNSGKDVAATLLEPLETALFYQKHMTHHMVQGMPTDWMRQVQNVFLIRHPARVISSYAKKREGPMLADLGFVQQAKLFDLITKDWGQPAIVIDSTDIRAAPEIMLKRLCSVLGVEFQSEMLHWTPGPKPFDGAWAAHWYGAVHQSSGFDAAEGSLPDLPSAYSDLVNQAMPYYEKLGQYKL